MSRKSRRILNIAGVALTALMLVGCKKPPPPPLPPPPPPPPPPPAMISLDTIAQNEKADARVTFSSDLKVTEDKTELGKAVVHLADAFARGDAKALKPLLTQPARVLLDQLVTDGGWEEATKPIEAVRVVFMQDGVDVNGIGSAGALGSEINVKIMSKVTEILKGIPPEQLATMQKALTSAMAGLDPNALASDPSKLADIQSKLTDAAKQAGMSDEIVGKLADLQKEIAGDAPAAGGPSGGSTLGILMAIQDPQGAYVLGWAAEKIGDAWMFSNTSATRETRARAAMWDGVGPEGFLAVRVAAAPTVDEMIPGAAPSGGGGDRPGGGSSPDSAPPPSSPEPSSPPVAPPPRAPGSPGRPPGGSNH
jgi:hypothetical protein